MSVPEDTIAAIATPQGVGGIGIIRISGPKAEGIGRLLFKPKKPIDTFRSHYLHSGDIVAPETHTVLDEVLFTFMKAPHSYTGEDTVEIHCHGGPVILDTVLHEVLKAGARPAEPGEFTKRAFLNNRLDLSQAEAVIDLITAKTQRGLGLALAHLKGDLSQKITELRSSLIEILAILETSIDFTEEDIDGAPSSGLSHTIHHVANDISEILATYSEGKMAREGVTVVITGKPNVGKSSLLNRFLGEDRAIITPIPGTTRDFIEGDVLIKGVPIKLIDTAGVRDVENIIEREGIKLVWEQVRSADLIIILLDGSTELTSEDMEIIEKNRSRVVLPVINKTDLPQKLEGEKLSRLLPGLTPRRISAKYGEGIPELKEELHTVACDWKTEDTRSDVVLTNLRHKIALEKVHALLVNARDNTREGRSPEFAAFDVKEALDSLGEIVGETTTEDVLDKIFSTFCIGK